jgi:hypothetical protein
MDTESLYLIIASVVYSSAILEVQPTAMQVDSRQLTSFSIVEEALSGSGVGSNDQALPFQRSAKGRSAAFSGDQYPTLVQVFDSASEQLMASSTALIELGGFGLV